MAAAGIATACSAERAAICQTKGSNASAPIATQGSARLPEVSLLWIIGIWIIGI